MAGQDPSTPAHRGHELASLALVALLVLSGGLLGCSGEANEICNKIYDDCAGAIVDEQGASISREACVRLFEERASENAEAVQTIAHCVANTSCSEDLKACFTGS